MWRVPLKVFNAEAFFRRESPEGHANGARIETYNKRFWDQWASGFFAEAGGHFPLA